MNLILVYLQVVCENLLEMNEDVSGEFRCESISAVLSSDPEWIAKFSVVVASHVSHQDLLPLSQFCWSNNIHLVVSRNFGFHPCGSCKEWKGGHMI